MDDLALEIRGASHDAYLSQRRARWAPALPPYYVQQHSRLNRLGSAYETAWIVRRRSDHTAESKHETEAEAQARLDVLINGSDT